MEYLQRCYKADFLSVIKFSASTLCPNQLRGMGVGVELDVFYAKGGLFSFCLRQFKISAQLF
jgi:hypothetical protein